MKYYGPEYGLAPWKINNPIEQWLSYKADNSEFWKRLYVLYYRLFDSKYYKGGIKQIEKNIKLFDGSSKMGGGENYQQLMRDMVYSLHRFGCMFDEYFLFNFPKLNSKGRETYITDKNRWKYYYSLNSQSGRELLKNKYKFYCLFHQYFKRELLPITSLEDKEKYETFTINNSSFIIKPNGSSGGRGVRIVKSDETSFESLISEKVICEELIKQSDIMSQIHPKSVNTLRVPTIKTKRGIDIFYPLLRVGVGDSNVDNATSGGIFALVDKKTGLVFTEARDEKANVFIKHPDTGICFPGFQIPDWESLIEIVKELATIDTGCCYTGWDMAHTDAGWVLVEGNASGQLVMMQLFSKQGIKYDLEKVLKNNN